VAPGDKRYICCDCGQAFVVTPDERRRLREIGQRHGFRFKEPRRCYPCRRAKRRAQRVFRRPTETPIALTCGVCGETFVFSTQQQAEFARRGFCLPYRCPAHRRRRPA
jgi:hypothetical protein